MWSGETFSTHGAAALAGIDEAEADQHLGMLVRLNLVQRESAPGLYSLHPLLKEYASWALDQRGEREQVEEHLRAYWQAETAYPQTLLTLKMCCSEAVSPEAWAHKQKQAQDIYACFHGLVRSYRASENQATWQVRFGAHPAGRAQAPESAVRCALDLQARLTETQVSLSTGIAQMGTQPAESGLKIEDLSAALCADAGSNGILCNEAVYRLVRRHFSFGPPVSVSLIDSEASVPAFPLVAAVTTPPFGLKDVDPVGRETELAQLAEWLDEAAIGQPRFVTISGPAGIGKSLLAAKLLELGRERGFNVYSGASSTAGVALAYTAWTTIFSQVLKLGRLSRSQARMHHVRRVLERLDPALLEQMPLLNDILPLKAPETSWSRHLEPRQRYEALTALLLRLLDMQIQAGPILFLVEDAHWLDSLSWTFVLELARAPSLATAPFLLALVHRPFPPETSPSCWATLRSLPGHRQLELAELSPPAIHELGRQVLGMPVLPPELAEWLDANVPGNPLYIREALNQLIDQGILQPDEPEV